MKQFILTSTGFEGSIIYRFDEEDKLKGFDIEATLTDSAREWIINSAPRTVEKLMSFPMRSKTIKLQEVPMDLTFDNFWTKYGYKVGDKAKTEKLWKAMNDGEKTEALNKINKYNAYLESTGVGKVYAERYLSKKYYQNDYK